MLLGELALSQYDCSASLIASNILAIVIDSSFVEQTAELRNKSWKPECVLSFNMDWQILVFYPEPEARDTIY
jgi:hypothetical protein